MLGGGEAEKGGSSGETRTEGNVERGEKRWRKKRREREKRHNLHP